MAKPFKKPEIRPVIDGTELVEVREKAGLNQGQFAEICGWSPQWQSQLEIPGEHKISPETGARLKEVISQIK